MKKMIFLALLCLIATAEVCLAVSVEERGYCKVKLPGGKTEITTPYYPSLPFPFPEQNAVIEVSTLEKNGSTKDGFIKNIQIKIISDKTISNERYYAKNPCENSTWKTVSAIRLQLAPSKKGDLILGKSYLEENFTCVLDGKSIPDPTRQCGQRK